MATLDDSPSLFSGQQWTDWAESVLPGEETEVGNSDTAEDGTEADSMKLKIEDMPLFGICPSRDEFYLVVCDKCNQVLKPQAFQAHLDVRHGGKGSYSASSQKYQSSTSRHSVSSKSHSSSKSHKSSHSKTHGSPSKTSHRSHTHSKYKHHEIDIVNSGSNIIPHVSAGIDMEDVKAALPTKTSVREPPQSLDTATSVGADTDSELVKDSKLNISSGIPVVKVERMPETLAMKKQREPSGSARTSPMTNGSLRSSKSPPLSMPVITDTEEDIKPSLTTMPVLKPTQGPADIYLEEMDTVPVSEINSAVSSILEPVSPVSEPETGSFIALATSSSTITTNTVTMASLTTATTSVTNVINTNSSFTFGSLGRPSFPMGSIRVNFSSTGVLSTISGDGNNNNSASVSKSSVSLGETSSKTSVLSNGSMESTISDIVKSAVNSGNTGGFKSLSPLLTSPNKSISNINSSFKSPSKLGNIGKSLSSSSLTKPGTKLSSGLTNVFKPLSVGSTSTTCELIVTTDSVTAANTEAIKKFQRISKPDKIIPLKDREYDPNKHCGVIVAETGKHCTRSLTCKSHALSLRRAVNGRRLSFDDLLKEHREAKEAYHKAKLESEEAVAALKAQAANKGHTTHTVPPLSKLQTLGNVPSSTIKPVSHTHPALNKENKSLSVPVFPVTKPQPAHQATTISSHRLSLSSIGSPSSNDELQSPTGKSFSGEDSDDNAFTSYHPRPIAACSFGARYHNNYGTGFGCYTFGRRTDHLRAAFLDLLEKHSNPPPPKKLCVEANLPREQDNVLSNSDPYEFGFLDASRNSIGQHIIQAPAGLVSTVAPNQVISKQKSKSASINHSALTGSKPKLKESFVISKPPNSGTSITPGILSSSAAKKRRSNSSGGVSLCSVSQSSIGATLVTAPSILANVGALCSSTGGSQQQFAIAIPSMNISGATLGQLGASLVASGNFKSGSKNAVMKDTMGFVVTNIPQEALLNGQIVNITNSQLTTDLTSNQLHSGSQDEGNKPVQQINVITSKQLHQQPKLFNSSIDAIRALQSGKGGLITGLPPNAVLLDGSLQPGAMLQPVTLTTSSGTPVVSVNSAILNQHQQHQNHTAASSHFIRSNSDGHQVTSSMPNGIIANTNDTCQRHTVFQSKDVPQSMQQQQRGTIQQASHIFTGAQLHNQNFTFQAPNSGSMTNQISVNASQVLPGHLTQLQVKNSNLHKAGTLNKLNMQPVSITIPFLSQNSVTGVEMGVRGHQHGHTLFITSEEAQKQGIHLQQTDQTNTNSPNPLMS